MTVGSGEGGRLTTHILDTMAGRPGTGIRIELYRLSDGGRELVKSTRTDADGRCAEPLLSGPEVRVGTYELVFHVGDYFAARGVELADPRFLDRVPVRFGLAAPDRRYHVPLLISPYGYSTYKGS
ncbi:MAG: hydroxyisourate hydrolase [Kiloniellaceae bacterium]